MKVVPDMVELSLRAYSVKPAMKDAVMETQLAVHQITAVCKKYVVDPADIQVSSISTNKAYDYRNGSEQIIGYDALQILDVTLKDIRKIEQFTGELLATESPGSITFGTTTQRRQHYAGSKPHCPGRCP